jgi:hypothetical protein
VTVTKATDLASKSLNQLRKISEQAGEAVDLVDHDHIDLTGFDVRKEPFKRRAVEIAAGKGRVILLLGRTFHP